MKKIRFTQVGFAALKKKYDALKRERPDAVEHLKKARELGDLSENGYYKASRAKLSFIDSQLRRIEYQLKNAEIIEEKKSEIVTIGSTVTIQNSEKTLTYQIVGDLEANPTEGKLSLLSPIGKAIEGKKAGEQAVFKTPTGESIFQIISVS